ncbi:MAG: hypothetical protein Q9157_006886 [Trypethelium eluteriae]
MEHLGLQNIGESIQVSDFKNCYDPNIHKFHAFPENKGWELKQNGEFRIISTADRPSFTRFLQSWLFFGLLSTVVYLGPDEEIDLNSFRDYKQITTRPLSKYLDKWIEAEIKHPNGQLKRMFRTQTALDKAWRVVQKYCSLHADAAKEPPAESTTYRVDPAIALSLMVLGETLAASTAKIVKHARIPIRGWHSNVGEGWGTPRVVISKMEESNWCKRVMHVIRSQLEFQAIALLFLYAAHPRFTEGHGLCSEESCKKKAENDEGYYKTQHMPNCNQAACRDLGPAPTEIAKAITEDKIPLLKFVRSEDQLQVQVIAVAPAQVPEYVTISHVWADGYGNTDRNELRLCQLKYFRGLFGELKDHGHNTDGIAFWINTLAIPVSPDKLRVRAVRQIYNIYTRAKYTIIIDNGLRVVPRGTFFEMTAMKIFACGWMRRLWTLQEVYLSRRVFFVFNDNHLVDLDELEDQYQITSKQVITRSLDENRTNIPNAARYYFYNIMGQERLDRIRSANQDSNISLVISAWRAAHWRTTTHAEHEVIALATLFNLINRHASFAEASVHSTARDPEDIQKKIRDLWNLLEEAYPHSIPSGIIFLPGDKIDIDGFRWAPKTFMVGKKLDHPDPLRASSKLATLETNKGLLVIYPGFLLHTQNARERILDPHTVNDEFLFATINPSSSEWYSVRPAEIRLHRTIPRFPRGTTNKFAVILSHSSSMQSSQLGLLVEIIQTSPPAEIEAHATPTTYHVIIVCRVYVKRLLGHQDSTETKERILSRTNIPQDMVLGVELDSKTKWYVGGKEGSTFANNTSDNVTKRVTSAPASSKLIRSLTTSLFLMGSDKQNQAAPAGSAAQAQPEPAPGAIQRAATMTPKVSPKRWYNLLSD